MARWFEPTTKQQASWEAWVSERPESVRAIAARFPPWELYRLKSTGQRVSVVSIFENGTLKVHVNGAINYDFVYFTHPEVCDFDVFGVDPRSLEPCEIPDWLLNSQTLESEK